MTSLEQQTRRTIQSQVRDDFEIGIGLLFNLAKAGEILPPWWSKQRDIELARFVQQSDHFQGAEWMISSKLTGVPFRVEARDRSVKRWVKMADEYQALLENVVQFGEGWVGLWSRFFNDLWHTDNGAFTEVIGDGKPDGPLQGPALSLAHLDSLQCTRTSNPEYPVLYQDVSGKRYRLHHTRVIFRSQQPSARANMYGVGHCWLTRAINNVRQLIDQDVYYQEALGSRPMREIKLGRGIDAGDMISAVKRAEEGMDNQGLSRFAKTVFVGDRHRTDISIDTIPMTFLPDGYDKQEQTTIAMFLIALAGGFPPRWLWPATQAGATKADAMWQHIGTAGAGALWHINMMKDLLSYTDRSLAISNVLPPKFLPKELYLEFDYQDDEQDRQQAEIRDRRASTRKTDLEDGVITIRVAREQALAAGDITQAQFNQMEIQDGRLPDGASILSLFDSLDPLFVEMLDLGVDEPLLIDANDPIEMILAIEAAALEAQARMVQARSAAERAKAEQALEALGALKAIYEEIVTREIEEEIAAEQQAGEFELPETAPEETTETPGEEQVPEETEEKAFNFGAKLGERGRGGRFASEADVGNIRSEMLSRLIARLRAKRAAGTGKGGKGAAKKPKKGGGGKKKPAPRLTQAGENTLSRTKQTDEPPRGDFEQEIQEQLEPIFKRAQVRTLRAVKSGEQPDNERLRQELVAMFVPVLTDAALFKLNMFEDQFSLAFDAGETQVEAERWARQHASAMVNGLVNTTENITNGIEPDATDEEIEATVDRAFNEGRRERIGITETTVALMTGALLYQRLARQQNVEIELRWFTREDERVCPVCRPLHSTTQDVWSQQFPEGPPAHVKCRCDVIATRKRG